MLDSITVKNLALIRSAQLELGPGLNILSGETGAGKSILIGSVNYCLGAKADKGMIREGAEYALVELVFHVENKETIEAIRAMELPVEEDGSVIISRRIGMNRSSIKVCGESVSVKQVRELAALLIDVHGQHEHQSLLHPARHRELLDAYCGEELAGLLKETEAAWHRYTDCVKREKSLDLDDSKRKREMELAEYEINEIEAAGIRPGEENELEERYRRMKKGRDSFEGTAAAAKLLDDNAGGALDALGRAAHELRNAADIDESLEDQSQTLTTCEDMLRDLLRELNDRLEDGAFDPELFDETERRLDELHRLMAKYGDSEERILEYLEQKQAQYRELEDLDASRARLAKEKAAAEKELKQLCGKVHAIREKTLPLLEKEIVSVLNDLNFLKVSFHIELKQREEAASYGTDDVEFMISLNPGEKLRPLKDVASGGELSRIMLALKTVFASRDGIETLIFDEIDTGISGKTAWKVSEKMGELSRERQLICITHLPQIAAMADTHFMIEKEESEGKTQTGIQALSEEEEIEEISRMLGGDPITEAARSNAAELKRMACEVKGGK